MTEYESLRRRILKAESMGKLQELLKEISNADLTEDDKFSLGANIRARYGNLLQFSG
jgi:hypothetical protein